MRKPSSEGSMWINLAQLVTKEERSWFYLTISISDDKQHRTAQAGHASVQGLQTKAISCCAVQQAPGMSSGHSGREMRCQLGTNIDGQSLSGSLAPPQPPEGNLCISNPHTFPYQLLFRFFWKVSVCGLHQCFSTHGSQPKSGLEE